MFLLTHEYTIPLLALKSATYRLFLKELELDLFFYLEHTNFLRLVPSRFLYCTLCWVFGTGQFDVVFLKMFQSSTKPQLRASTRALRDTLPDVSSAVCQHLANWLRQDKQQESPYMVLGYKAFGTEISLEALPALLPKLQFLTTRVATKNTLTLHEFSSATAKNRFGILEPPPDTPIIVPARVDVVLVPGLAFTRDGGRLGYGGGFYDRLLPQLRSDCLLVGVTHSKLLVKTLPLESHDVRMQFLALETGVVVCDPKES